MVRLLETWVAVHGHRIFAFELNMCIRLMQTGLHTLDQRVEVVFQTACTAPVAGLVCRHPLETLNQLRCPLSVADDEAQLSSTVCR